MCLETQRKLNEQISMELCSGGAMDWIYRNYPKSLSEDQICIILHGALKGLQYLHDVVFLIHRDIKSGNILITDSGEVKLGKKRKKNFSMHFWP